MIVEFIGCTGSGKTTLIRRVRFRLAQITRVVTAHDLIAGRVGLSGVTNPTGQNLIEEAVGFPYFLRSLPRYWAFLALNIQMLTRDHRPPFLMVNYLRSLERKIGGYELSVRAHRNVIVLVDEGPVQAAHMLAASAASLADAEISRFAYLLPLPDLIVYVTSPLDTLVKRTLRRADPPREVRSKSRTETATYILDAVAIFDRLVQVERLRSRVLVVENAGRTQQEYDDLVDQIVQSILSWGPAHYPSTMPERFIPGVS